MGIVLAMVNSPHGLAFSAFTTTRASTARRMIMIARMASIAAIPATGFTSSFAIWPRDFPSRRSEAKRMTKSCTAPPSDHARDEPQRARQVAELRGQHRADERPRPRDGGEVVAEEHPLVGRHEVAAVAQPLGRRRAAVIEAEDLERDEPGVEPVGDDVARTRRRRGSRRH